MLDPLVETHATVVSRESCVMDKIEILALTPPGLGDPSLAIAACRAGGLGTLDLEYRVSLPTAQHALERLRRFTSSPFAVKVGQNAATLLPPLLDSPARP